MVFTYFNKEEKEEFEAAYNKAVLDKVKHFDYKGHTFYIGFAKYVVEYLNLKQYEK